MSGGEKQPAQSCLTKRKYGINLIMFPGERAGESEKTKAVFKGNPGTGTQAKNRTGMAAGCRNR